MITLADILYITINMRLLGQSIQNVWTYQVVAQNMNTDATGVAVLYWQVVRTAFRALVLSAVSDAFVSIAVRDALNPFGAFGEHPIPSDEQGGTRSASGEAAQLMPPFAAVGVKLTVGTRTTRPGHKRIPFLLELDQAAGLVQPTFRGLVKTLLDVQEGDVTLDAGAGNTLTLRSVVLRRTATVSTTPVFQNTTGYTIAPAVTTQNTRKIGRGV